MNKLLIKKYISKITKKDIYNFAKKNKITLNDEELNIIDYHIKTNWNTIIYGNATPIMQDLKNKINYEQYNKIEKLYNEFKEKYKNYL